MMRHCLFQWDLLLYIYIYKPEKKRITLAADSDTMKLCVYGHMLSSPPVSDFCELGDYISENTMNTLGIVSLRQTLHLVHKCTDVSAIDTR